MQAHWFRWTHQEHAHAGEIKSVRTACYSSTDSPSLHGLANAAGESHEIGHARSYRLVQGDLGMCIGCTVACGCVPPSPDDDEWTPCQQKVHLDGAHACQSGWFGMGFYLRDGRIPWQPGAYQAPVVQATALVVQAARRGTPGVDARHAIGDMDVATKPVSGRPSCVQWVCSLCCAVLPVSCALSRGQ